MIESGTYAQFSKSLHDMLNPMRVPVNGTIEVSDRCPLDCAHCYNNLPMDDSSARNREMSLADHKRLLDELAEMGCLWLLYTGGEIFARHDFLEIYTYAKQKGFIVTLFTNGTMITERIADYLKAFPPFAIEITLYGGTKETYEALTGVPGSYEKCFRGIKLLLDRNLPLKLKTVAVSINVHEVPLMKSIAEELGLEFKFDPMINPRIDCSASPLEVRLSPAEIVALDLDDPERVAEWRRLALDCAPIPPKSDADAQVYSCGGGVNSWAIDPYGDLSICVLSHVDRYNVRTGTFREGWETYLRGVRSRKAERITKCTRCALRSLCGQCAANGELEAGDAEAPVDFLCQTAHLRAEMFDVDVPEHGDCEYCRGSAQRHVIDELAEMVRARNFDAIEAARNAMPAAAAASSCGSGTCGACSIHTP